MPEKLKKNFAAKAARPKKKPAPEFLIFCDMDGVVSDFDTHAKAQGKFNEKGNPIWDKLDLAWWRSMPAYEGAKEFFGELRDLGRTRFLTAPILDAGCFRGKAEWVQGFRKSRFGLLDLVVCPAVDKNLLARPNHILVDDREKNIKEWVEAGGIGILHTGDYADTLKRVKEAMEAYKANPPPAPKFVADEKREIFIGSNGVLADFAGHAKATGKLNEKDQIRDWTDLPPAWWQAIPAYPGANAFYDTVAKLGDVRLLTGPVPHPDGFEGDARWTMKFRPKSGKFALRDLIVCRSKDKNLLARPGKVLIDDRQSNIDDWVKAGGIGILHKGDYADTLKRLNEAIATEAKPAAPAAPGNKI